jgi:hypothetical protein
MHQRRATEVCVCAAQPVVDAVGGASLVVMLRCVFVTSVY